MTHRLFSSLFFSSCFALLLSPLAFAEAPTSGDSCRRENRRFNKIERVASKINSSRNRALKKANVTTSSKAMNRLGGDPQSAQTALEAGDNRTNRLVNSVSVKTEKGINRAESKYRKSVNRLFTRCQRDADRLNSCRGAAGVQVSCDDYQYEEPEVDTSESGDLNCDGTVGIADAVRGFSIATGQTKSGEICGLNLDGRCGFSLQDVQFILNRFVAGASLGPDSKPSCPVYSFE